MPMIHDENEFLLLRRRLPDQSTISEHRRAQRITNTMDYDDFDLNIDPFIKAKLLKRQQRANSIFLHYKHENRFSFYKRAIHQIRDGTLHNVPVRKIKLIVGTLKNPNLVKEFVRKSPYIKKNNNRNDPTTT